MAVFCKEVGIYDFTVTVAEGFIFPWYLSHVSLHDSKEWIPVVAY